MADVARVLVEGSASGPVVVLDEPLSFWGGLDPETGTIIDERHPQRGVSVTGSVLVMETGRGSSSSSSVLAEAVRRRTGPAAIVMLESDEIVALGAIVAEELYGTQVPVLVVNAATYAGLTTGAIVEIDGNSLRLSSD